MKDLHTYEDPPVDEGFTDTRLPDEEDQEGFV